MNYLSPTWPREVLWETEHQHLKAFGDYFATAPSGGIQLNSFVIHEIWPGHHPQAAIRI